MSDSTPNPTSSIAKGAGQVSVGAVVCVVTAKDVAVLEQMKQSSSSPAKSESEPKQSKPSTNSK